MPTTLLLLLALTATNRVKGDDGCSKGIDGNNELDGEITCVHSDGTKKYEGMYAHGKRVGVAKTWRQNGNLASVEHFVDGKRTGLSEEYDLDGKLESACQLKDDKKHGPCKLYSRGELREERSYVNGEQRGAYTEFNTRTGKPSAKGFLDDQGKYDGKREWFRDDGSPESLWTLSHGKREGVEKTWHSNGKQATEVLWKNDQRHGIAKTWAATGELTDTTCYQNNDSVLGLNACNGKTGSETVTRSYANGKPREVISVVDGKRQGEMKTFDPEGQQRSSAEYKADKLDGVSKRFEKGVLVEQVEYKAGKQHGLSQKWTDGKLVESVEYAEGQRRSVKTFFMNGKPRSTDLFDGDFINRTTWFDNGQKRSDGRVLYGNEWSYDGLERQWNEAGVLVEEANFVKGRRDGVSKRFFDKTGKPQSEETWKDGVRASLKEWDESGALIKSEEYYPDGSRK